MEKKKVVITASSKLNSRWFNYFCLKELNDVYDLEYWDCSEFTYPRFDTMYEIPADFLVKLKTKRDFLKHLKQLPPNTLLITDIHRNAWNVGVHKLQAKYLKNLIYIDFYTNTVSRLKGEQRADRREKLKNACIFLYYLEFIIFWTIRPKEFLERLFFVISTHFYSNNVRISCKVGSEYQINHPDFDMFLKIKDKERIINERYVLYIDDFFPYHPEIKRFESSLIIEDLAIPFFNSMNKFFKNVEKEYNCKVVIAAHPSAKYTQNPFEGRDVYYGKTAELVKDCEAVCLHASNALSFVALFNKPAANLHNDSFRKSKRLWSMTQISAELLGIPLVDTDNSDAIDVFSQADEIKRKKYVTKYFGNINKKQHLNSELLVSHLNRIWDMWYGSSIR